MKWSRYIFLLFLLGNLLAQENYRVRKIKFAGNDHVPTARLVEKMSLAPQAAKNNGAAPATFSREQLRQDLAELTRFYQTEGFLTVQITADTLAINKITGTLDLLLSVREGAPVVVRDVFFRPAENPFSAEIQAAVEQLRGKLLLAPGARFRDQDLAGDINRLRNALVNSGFAYARVDYALDVHDDEHFVHIIYTITGGPRCYFGPVTITGNTHVAGDIIRKQLAFKEGDVFSRAAIDKSQEQIYALAVFQIASLKAALAQPDQTQIPISITIKESPQFTNKFGVGYGKEDRFRAFVDVTWLRFFGGARRLNLVLKHSGLEPYNVDLRFIQPAFLHPTASVGLNPFILKQVEPAYTVDRRGANIFLQRQLKQELSTGITYTFEQVSLDTTSIGDLPSLTAVADLYNKSSITLGLSQTTTNDLFSPTAGFNNGLTYKFSGIGPSTYNYTKWMVDLRYYLVVPRALAGRGVLASRLKVGLIQSMNTSRFIPLEDRFYAGGSNSTRGWARHELGPQDADGRPVGGSALLEGSLELRLPIYRSFSGAVFWDFGNVWAGGFGNVRNELRHSLGAGLRFHTPIGPVRFDIARPVLDVDSHIRWHLTLGQAF